jgi:hypothetical protein
MRFISQYPAYGVQIRRQKVLPLGDGTSQVLQEPLYIHFTSADSGGMIYDKERYAAAEHFRFHGSQQYDDEATPVETIHRLSVLDTVEDAEKNGWSAEDVAEIEDVLTRKTMTTPMAVMAVAATPMDPPFPTFDSYDRDPQQLVIRLVEDGHDLEKVLYYERTFGQKRPEMISALEAGVEAIRELTVPA